MSTATRAVDISKAWLAYVTDRFMLENGCIRPEVEDEYRRLESADSFTQDRELWRTYTDTLIDKILQSPPEMRRHFFTTTDYRSLAYVQDRIQCGTELLTAMVQKGLQVNTEGIASLDDYFRAILLQRPEA
jgi:hypothetical protein